jgi:hypothetical protein
MKIVFEPKSAKLVRGVILVIAVVMVGFVAYAVTQLSVNISGSVVLATKNWQIITFNPGAVPASAAACPTTGYSEVGPFTISLASIPQGTSVVGGVCVKNVSTGPQSYTASTAASPAPVLPAGTVVTYSVDGGTSSSGSIAPGGISLLTINVSAGQSVGPISFTVTIG